MGSSKESSTTIEMKDAIISALTDDLRRKPWKGNANPLAGHCYVASEALYHLTGKTMTPQVIRHEGSTHWYLKDKSGTIHDLTAGQFKTPVPYHQGKGCGFLTKLPSKRAQIVIGRVIDGQVDTI